MSPADLLADVIREWVEDPASDVEYAEMVDGRWAVRLRQSVRDATTVWWEVGQRTIRAEAYLFPAPSVDPAEAYRQCLTRNARSWRAWLALDRDGALVVRSRVAVGEATREVLDAVLGEIYDLVEVAFPPLRRLANREKTP